MVGAAAPLEPQRHQFDIPDDVAYLNTAYMGPLPREAVDAGRSALDRKAQPWSIGVPEFFEPVEQYREAVARLIGADIDGVAVTPSVSYGIATSVANLDAATGQRIVVLAEQFPSNVYAWRLLADHAGATVHTIARPPDADWTAAVLASIDRDVAVVAIPAVHWTDGSAVDLGEVAAAVRSIDAALIVDGSQAVGAMPIDVTDLQPDFLVGTTYKWLLGPYSLGFLYAAPHRRQGTPLEHNWIARAGSDDFAGLVSYRDEFRAGARRYDMGEVSNFSLIPVALASLRLIDGWGVDRIASACRHLTDRVAAGATELGLRVPPDDQRAPHMIGLRLPSTVDPSALARRLAGEDVHVSIRGDAVRVSAHVYNTDEDVDRLLSVLAETVR